MSLNSSDPSIAPTKIPSIIVSKSPTIIPSFVPLNKTTNSNLPQGFSATWFNNRVQVPRALYVTPGGNVLVVDTVASTLSNGVLALFPDGSSFLIAQPPSSDPTLTHGVTVNKDKVYASTATTVYQWSYTEGQTSVSLNPVPVITNMPSGGYTTRPLAFDSKGLLYVEVGAQTTTAGVDSSNVRSKIKSFDITVGSPLNWNNGQDIAVGIRNSPGIAFDRLDSLWVADIQVNAFPSNFRPDLGIASQLIENYPAGRLIRISSQLVLNYGYPYCWSEGNISSPYSRGTTDKLFSYNLTIHNDSWCRSNTQPATLNLFPHASPTGLTFFNAKKTLDPSCPAGSAFPSSYDGDLFLALHGSISRTPPSGYTVLHVPIDSISGLPGVPTVFLSSKDTSFSGYPKWVNGFRPTDVKFDKCNRLLISSDGTVNSQNQRIGAGVMIISYNQIIESTFSPTILPSFAPNSDNNDNNHNRSGVSTGVVAGSVIAAFVFGLIVSYVVYYFFAKRNNDNTLNSIQSNTKHSALDDHNDNESEISSSAPDEREAFSINMK